MAKIKMQPLDAENVTLEECFADYMAKCRARNLSYKMLEICEERFSMFQKYLGGKELKKLLKKPNLKRCEFNEYKTCVFSNYLLVTGNRISTLLNLQIRDLDFDNNIIQLNKMKNRKAQIVPTASSLAVILKEYLAFFLRNN